MKKNQQQDEDVTLYEEAITENDDDDNNMLSVVPYDMSVHLQLKEQSFMLDITLQLTKGEFIDDIVEKQLIKKHHIALHYRHSITHVLNKMIQEQVWHIEAQRFSELTSFSHFSMKVSDYKYLIIEQESNSTNSDEKSTDSTVNSAVTSVESEPLGDSREVTIMTSEDYWSVDPWDNIVMIHSQKQHGKDHNMAYQFHEMYHHLFQHGSIENHLQLIKIEQQMNLMYQRRMVEKETDIARLRYKQSMDMEQLCNEEEEEQRAEHIVNSSNEDPNAEQDQPETHRDVSEMVQSQMQDMENLETKWNNQLRDLKRELSRQYAKFVADLFSDQFESEGSASSLHNDVLITKPTDFSTESILNGEITDKMIVNELESIRNASCVTPTDSELTPRTAAKRSRQPSIIRSSSPSSIDFSKYSVSSIFNYFREDKKMNVNSTPNINQNEDKRSTRLAMADMDIPTFLIDNNIMYFRVDELDFRIYFAHVDQMAECMCQIHIPTGDENRADECNLIQRSRTKRKLYNNRMNALVLTCHPVVDEREDQSVIDSFVWNSQEFYQILFEATDNCAPELHFDELSTQLDYILEDYNELDTSRLANDDSDEDIGRFFITKHSNLSNMQLIYHIVTNNTEASLFNSEDDANFSSHIKKVITHCLANGVVTIGLPLPLTFSNHTLSTSRNVATSLYQIEQMIRMCFANSDNLSLPKLRQLRNIIFFLPRNGSFMSDNSAYDHKFRLDCKQLIEKLFKGYQVSSKID